MKVYIVSHIIRWEGSTILGVYSNRRDAIEHRDRERAEASTYSIGISEWVDVEVWDTKTQENSEVE